MNGKMDFRFILLIELFVVVMVSGQFEQRVGQQTARAVCIKYDSSNQLKLEFRLGLNGDNSNTARLDGLTNVNNGATNCNKLESTVGSNVIWSVTSVVNTASQSAFSNGCGFSSAVNNNGNREYTWRLYYHELSARQDIDAGLNRYYTVTCKPSTMVSNEVSANITISTPNMNVVVTPYVPDVAMYIMFETKVNTNFFRKYTVSDGAIPIGTLLKLRLEHDYGTFDSNKYYGVAGLKTVFDYSSLFPSPTGFFNDQGCPIGSYAPQPQSNVGYTRTTSGSGTGIFVQETNTFPAWKSDSSDELHFKTTIVLCLGAVLDSEALCINTCQVRGRRRRDVNPREPEDMVVKIRVGEKADKEVNSEGMTGLLIGLCVAAVLVLVVLVLAVCVVLSQRRRRNRRQNSEKAPPQEFENKIVY